MSDEFAPEGAEHTERDVVDPVPGSEAEPEFVHAESEADADVTADVTGTPTAPSPGDGHLDGSGLHPTGAPSPRDDTVTVPLTGRGRPGRGR